MRGAARISRLVALTATILLAAAACDTRERGAGRMEGGWVEGPLAAFDEGLVAEDPDRAGLLEHRHRPSTTGMDDALVAEAVERAAGLPRLHNMIVARHGEVVVERHFRGPPPDRTTNVKSASKSLLSAVVGLAIADGYLEGVDQPVLPFFEGELDAATRAARRGITLGHLLSMTSGLESTSSRNYGRWVTSSNWVRHALTRPMVARPGERMEYSTGSTHLASAVLVRATGRSVHAYARERLAEPLGIRLPSWPRDPQGVHFGGNDMLVSPRGLLRFGELYRNGGHHEGRQLLPREWVERSWAIRTRSPRRSRNGYGFGWWARDAGPHEVRFAWGYGGQFVFVVPALELTVVFTSDPVSPREGPHNRSLHDILDEQLVPAAERGSGPGVARAETQEPASR